MLFGRWPVMSALLAGTIAVPAFAPLGWFPFTILSLAALFLLWDRGGASTGLRIGFAYGLGFFGAGVSWVYVSIHQYGHINLVVSVLIMLVMIFYLSLFPAVLGYMIDRCRVNNTREGLVLIMPAGWVLAEWLRGWLFSGFPWLEVGNSQIDSPLSGFAPIAGIYGVGLAVALSAGLLVAMGRRLIGWHGWLLLVVLWSTGYLLKQVDWTVEDGEALRVTLVQGNIPQEEKWAPEQFSATIEQYLELTLRQGGGSDIIVWPETAIPAFYHQISESLLPYIEEEISGISASLLTGIPVLDMSSWDYYNAVMSLDGERAFYHKRHLVPFGEYLPLRGLIGDSLDALAVPNADFSAGGDDQPLLRLGGYPVGSSICYEIIFGAGVIHSLPEAAYLVNVSNDAWFGRSLAPHQHLEMARMRALETGRYLLRATNTGISAVIGPDGRIIDRSRQFEPATVTAEILPRTGSTPYVLAGNLPAITLALLLLCAGLLRTWRGRRRPEPGGTV